ncbi:MAG: hypothetical protein KatS3mg107_0805 [Gemmataceae bacterium]|jgi:hypothetical protein|nr:MAG: hypothetical protein KatS3mg107_0805 [Gemmataceae bacterium]
MPRWYRWMMLCLWIGVVAITGCGDSKTKIPKETIPLQPGGPQAAGAGGDGGAKGGNQQKNVPPGTGTVQ